jgi:ribonucleoside-diphosphate reductase beta chain
MTTISENLFNSNKTDYEQTPLWLGQRPGLHDSINMVHKKLDDLYKKLKSMDWDDVEFPTDSCKNEFKTLGTAAEMMIETIATQWEADSVAGRNLVPLVSPFVSSTTLWELYSRIGDNENLHARTYSEIIKSGFDNPAEVIQRMIEIQKAMKRLERIGEVFENTYRVGLRLQTGELSRDSDEAYDAIFMFTCALLCLERIQFMSSFAVTFALANSGMFMPIGVAVAKICADEYDIHAETGFAVLDIEMRSERGLMCFIRNRDKIISLLNEVIESEVHTAQYLFRDGRELPGISADTIIGYVWRCGKEVADFFRFPLESEYLEMPPLAYMEKWINLDKQQGSPMELRDGKYLLGGIISDDEDLEFETEGLLQLA